MLVVWLSKRGNGAYVQEMLACLKPCTGPLMHPCHTRQHEGGDLYFESHYLFIHSQFWSLVRCI